MVLQRSWVQILLKRQIFSGLSLQLFKLLHNCKDHFYFCTCTVRVAYNQEVATERGVYNQSILAVTLQSVE